jgi:membrane-bound inhibitor of C-type lysozyme
MNKTIVLSSTIAILSSFALLGCNRTPTPTASGQGELVNYQCKDGTTFSARITDREAITDLPNNPNLALPYVESNAGAKYSDGTITLEIHGAKAAVEINGQTAYTECRLTTPTTATQRQSPAPTADSKPAPVHQAPTNPPTASHPRAESRTERVQFQPGATSAVVEDAIVGYETVDYILGAQAGQSMNVSMATDNGANYFNILPPGKTDEAMFTGSMSGNQYEGTLPASGDYRVRVYMMRSAARRDEVANYRLEMIISGPGGNAARSNPVEGDATVGDTYYNATGEIPCAMSSAEANGSCSFGVVREGNGSGFIEVTTQYGNTFAIYYQNGEAVGAEGGSGAFSAARQGDETYVYIGEERYIIPDAVIYGG